jgi:hypothetical protein
MVVHHGDAAGCFRQCPEEAMTWCRVLGIMGPRPRTLPAVWHSLPLLYRTAYHSLVNAFTYMGFWCSQKGQGGFLSVHYSRSGTTCPVYSDRFGVCEASVDEGASDVVFCCNPEVGAHF